MSDDTADLLSNHGLGGILPGMFNVRFVGALLVAAAFGAGAAWGQGAPLSPEDVVRRDALVKPGLDDLKKGDPAGAFAALQPALAAFPKDEKVIMLSGIAAMNSQQNEVALELFERALAEKPADEWQVRFEVMMVEARLGKWKEFDANLVELKAAKKAANPQLDQPGFVVDQFEAGGQTVTVAYYPLLAGKFHTLFRFELPKPAQVDTSASMNSGGGDRCKDPDFRPYFDLESDDADQAFHPEVTKKGDRVYSLDTYPAACSQGLIKFYMGEPKYEDLRADVMKVLEKSAKK
jgi:tetratricopeptide (TPR) repeat protein